MFNSTLNIIKTNMAHKLLSSLCITLIGRYFMRYLILSIILIFITSFIFLSFAYENYNGNGSAFDYNLGSSLRLEIFGHDTKVSSYAGGAAVNLELLETNNLNSNASLNGIQGIFFIDANLKITMGAINGKNINYFYNMRGNITAGIQAYSLIPLTLSFEDCENYMTNDGLRGTHLVGTALLVPIGNILKINTNERQLVLTTTLGARVNNTVSHNEGSWPAIQIKIRFLDSNRNPKNRSQDSKYEIMADEVGFSAYSALLFDLSNRKSFEEKKSATGVAINNFIGAGTQIGFEAIYSEFKLNDNIFKSNSIIFFAGGDIF